MPFVVDAPIAVAWCFEDEASGYADRILDMLQHDAALVPSIWPLEIANALRAGERRRRLRPADVARFADMVCALPIMVDSPLLPRDLGPVLTLARTHRLSSYDASYIELAAREGLALATQDTRLVAVAKQIGIPLVP